MKKQQVGWLWLVAAIPKLLLLAADDHPGFHFGDSGAYLATALSKWIPPDRSFTYGFLLRPLVFETHSLLPVLLAQAALSLTASVVLGVLLLRYFHSTLAIALCFSFLCAIEPLQVMEERYIMPETFATVGFTLLVWASVEFLNSRKLVMLALVQLIGIVLVSLRFSFIPLMLVLSVALPALAFEKHSRVALKRLLTALFVAIFVSQGLLFGYRHLYGSLAHTNPSYLSRDGEFLAADMAPIISPQDFPIAKERAELAKLTTIPLSSIDNRRFQRWAPGGICAALLTLTNGNEDVANELARRTAISAIKRHPLGAIRLAMITYGQFLTYRRMRWGLALDQWGRMLRRGEFLPPAPNDVSLINGWFGIDARDGHFNSLTKRWEALAAPWCWLMVLLPWIYAAEIWICRRTATRFDIFLLICAVCILLTAIVPVEIANPRYLVPLPWLSILLLGIMFRRQISDSRFSRPIVGRGTLAAKLISGLTLGRFRFTLKEPALEVPLSLAEAPCGDRENGRMRSSAE